MVKFVSSNSDKIRNYSLFLSKYNASFEAINLDLTEIQTDSPKDLAVSKAKEAYNAIKQPLFINDAGWNIPALNGFPGPYMKYINKWLTSEDLLRLMKDITDRRIILTDYFICINREDEARVFNAQYEAVITENIVGNGSSIDKITKFNNINKTISEMDDEDRYNIFGENKVWRDIAEWINSIGL